MKVKRKAGAAAGFLLLLFFAGFSGAHAQPDAETAEDTATAEDAVTLKEKIGQMILVGFLGDKPERRGFELVRAQMEAGQIGGVLFLGRNLTNRQTVQRMNAVLKEAAPAHLPPLIAIDQEGGKVQRLRRRNGFPHTPSAKWIAQRLTPCEAALAYEELAEALSDWGFTLNLGPVVDVDVNPRNPIIGRLGRAYASDPKRVADYGAAFITAHRNKGVLTALKHFPGHGSSRRDSHEDAVDISRTWSADELKPFRQLIADEKVDLIMTAHVINRKIRGAQDNVPMSLSEAAIAGTLRNDLGFRGVVITDDIQMEAIRRNFRFEDAVLRAVEAQNDILLFANDKRPDPHVPERVAEILLGAAENDPLLAQKIDAAYHRILALKSRLSSRSDPVTGSPEAKGDGSCDCTGAPSCYTPAAQ